MGDRDTMDVAVGEGEFSVGRFGSDLESFEPWFKLDVVGTDGFVYVIKADREYYSEYGDFDTELLRVYRDGSLSFNEFDSYLPSDEVEGYDIDGVALYMSCVDRDSEFEDLTEEARRKGEL